jgi:hypothetical protein
MYSKAPNLSKMAAFSTQVDPAIITIEEINVPYKRIK